MKKIKITNKLGFRLFSSTLIVLAVLSLFIVSWIEKNQTGNLIEEEVIQGKTLAATLKKSLKVLMLTGNGALVRQWLNSLQATQGILDVTIMRRDMKEAFLDTETISSVNKFIGSDAFFRKEELPEHKYSINISKDKFDYTLSTGNIVVDKSNPKYMVILMPIRKHPECDNCHGYEKDITRGVLSLALSTERINNRIAIMKENLWKGYLFVAILISIVLWLSLHVSVIKPISSFHKAMINLSIGDKILPFKLKRNDELGMLGSLYENIHNALSHKEAKIKAIMDNVVDGIITINKSGIIESFNPAAQNIFGYSEPEVLGRDLHLLMPAQYNENHMNHLTNEKEMGIEHELDGLRKNGTVFPMGISISEMVSGESHMFIAMIRDITTRKAQTMALAYQALHDSLTDLPNRNMFFDKANQMLSKSAGANSNKYTAIILMDLNHFKEINDTLGHHIGDILLKRIGARLKDFIEDKGIVARLGGDEFALLLSEMSDMNDISIIAKSVMHMLEDPFVIDEQALGVGASLGISVYPTHGKDVNTLLQRADVAMYTAKRAGQGYLFYDAGKDQYSLRRLALIHDLKHAIDHKELLLHYQPKVSIKTWKTIGVEALVRWQHPKYGLIMPNEFITLVEQTGLIRPLTLWVIENALKLFAEMENGKGNGNGNDRKDMTVAINLSVKNLQDQHLVDVIADMLTSMNISTKHLILEITESAIMSDPFKTLNTIKRLNDMGIKFSIDDFGTGYSSMSYLKNLPVAEIKIDQSFVRGLDKNSNDEFIVKSIIDLGHNLGLNVIAEGVEDTNVWNILSRMGCDTAQGYHIGTPMTSANLMEWMDESDRVRGSSGLVNFI